MAEAQNHDHLHHHGRIHKHGDHFHYEAIDLQARRIMEFVAAIGVELNLEAFLKDKSKLFSEALNDLVESMLRANSDLRDFRIDSKKAEKEFKNSAKSNPERKTRQLTDAPEDLYSEYSKYLESVKESLDKLASVMNAVLGSDFKNWDTDKIVEYLEGLPQDQKDKMIGIADVIRDSGESLSYLEELRQASQSRNIRAAISELQYQYAKNAVVPLMISHPDGQIQPLLEFMDNTMAFLINFSVAIILRGLSYNEPSLVVLRAADRNGLTAYRAVPIDLLTRQNNV